MRLESFLESYPTVRLAGPEDNAAILEFFDRKPMATANFEVLYRRAPDFFALLRHKGGRSYVFVSIAPDGRVQGIGTISMRSGWLDERPVTVGYLGDLRVGSGRELTRLWRRLLIDLLRQAPEIDELAECTVWHTVILDGNLKARNSYRAREGFPSLVPVSPFTMRNLLARKPWAGDSDSGCVIRRAETQDRQNLSIFLERAHRALPMGIGEGLDARLEAWDGLRLEDFLLATDASGIVACCAPWHPTVKRTVVVRLPLSLRLVAALSRALPGLVPPVPGQEEELRALYLTHLAFAPDFPSSQRGPVVAAFARALFKERSRTGARWHCLSLCDFAAWDLGASMGEFFQQTVPITIYELRPPGVLTPSLPSGPVGFEMAMV